MKMMMTTTMKTLTLTLLCVSVCVSALTAEPLKCQWLDHRFRQYSKESLDLLDHMVSSTGTW